MLIPVHVLASRYGVQPVLVAHVGAHLAEEAHAYSEQGWKRVHWIEANPKLVDYLKELPELKEHSITQCVVSDQDNEQVVFKIASNSFSSSILDFGEHKTIYPSIVTTETLNVSTVTLNSIFSRGENPDFLNLDIQGTELKALKGASQIIKKVRWIYSEVSIRDLYIGGTHISELENYLKQYSFKRIALRINRCEGWGDALYINTNFIKITPLLVFKEIFSRFLWEVRQFLYPFRVKIHRLKIKTFGSIQD